MKKLVITMLSFLIILSSSLTVHASNLADIKEDRITIEKQEDSYGKTMKLNNKNNAVIALSNYDFSSKKITCIGDSITAGNGGSYDANGKQISYCNFLASTLGCEVVNLGIGGAAIGDYWDESSLILRWNQIPQDSDIIIIFAGVNDYFIGPDHLGDTTTRASKTYCGDTYALFSNIKNNYPNADIFVCTTYRNNTENWTQFAGYDFTQYMDIQKQYCSELGLNVIDLYSTGILDSRDEKTRKLLVPDDIHPNDAGNEILANEIAAELCLYYTK